MRPSLIALLLGAFFIPVTVWADSISNSGDFDFGHEFAIRNTSGNGLGHADFNFNGETFNSNDKSSGNFDFDNCFDSLQSNSSGKPQLTFSPRWGLDDHSDHDRMSDSYGWDHDHGGHWGYDPKGEGNPSLPTPEPESLWLLLTGMAVIGFCALLRRTLPRAAVISKLEG